MVFLVLMLIVVAWLVALPVCAWLEYVSRKTGMLDVGGTEAHKPAGRVVPNTAGVAVYVATALPIAGLMLSAWLVPPATWDEVIPAVSVHVEGVKQVTWVGGGLLIAMSVVHILGLIDDRHPLRPMVKLLIELAVAAGLAFACDMRVLRLFEGMLPEPMGYILSGLVSMLWIVMILNAFNFMDNMDGLTCGVTGVIAGVYLAATLLGQQWFVAALCALLLGAMLAVLIFNMPPARMFLGDGGSLLIGLLVAVITIRTTYLQTDPAGQSVGPITPWHALLMPAMVLAIPLYDFVSVCLLRIRRGRSPMIGDQNHFSHRLVRLGLTRKQAVLVIWLATLSTGVSGVMLGSLGLWQAVLAASQAGAVVLMIILLEKAGPPVQ